MSTDLLEMGRRLKRSLDGYITLRKAVAIAIVVFVFFIYIGPSLVRWLAGGRSTGAADSVSQCLQDRLAIYKDLVKAGNGHLTQPSAEGGEEKESSDFVHYVGNGYIGLAVSPESDFYIRHKRTLQLAVHYKPLVHLSLEGGVKEEWALVTDYKSGIVHRVQCMAEEAYGRESVSVSTSVMAHRVVPGVLVQDVKVHNPTASTVQLAVEKLGISDWKTARSYSRVIEYGDGGQKFSVVTGLVDVGDTVVVVAVASLKVSGGLEVRPRMTQSLHLLTSVSYSEPIPAGSVEHARREQEKLAVSGIQSAAGMTWQTLQQSHTTVWQSLWTTGFGISWSYADHAVNGHRINATMYLVLSHVPTPLHSSATGTTQRSELLSYLAYSEGCYAGIRTLEAPNLWTSLATQATVNELVGVWLLTLEKNGCHNLLKAGADGVVQAMVLSLPGLKFSNQHLELKVHPRELHRDMTVRRVSYGNETHINISIVVQADNRAALFVSLDRRNKDYFACDAGCLDAPVRLGPAPQQFPVKLTDPPTAILYITADHEHMMDLKHTIHVKEVVEAPAHEAHVLELHRHGGRLGGLPAIFWFSIAFLILVFHLFLFKLIYHEYCAGPDKYRIRAR